jgi:hypothetical protein
MATLLWSGWRRDVLVGCGAAALTALALVPPGVAWLRAERENAAAAREQAERSEAEAARLRGQAEQNYQLARRAVDDLFTAVAAEKLEPLDATRKKLLEEAKKLYERAK